MKIQARIAFVLFSLLMSATFAENTTGTAFVQFQIYRIKGDISGETSLTENVLPIGAPTTGTAAVQIFNSPKLIIAGHRLTMDERGWLWDDTPFPINGGPAPKFLTESEKSGVFLLSQPKMKMYFDQPARIFVGNEQPVAYMIRRADGAYEHRLQQVSVGLSVEFQVSKSGSKLQLKGLTIKSSTINSRKPLEGTPLNVGEPIINEQSLTSTLTIESGKEYGIMLNPNDGEGGMLIRLKVESPAPKMIE